MIDFEDTEVANELRAKIYSLKEQLTEAEEKYDHHEQEYIQANRKYILGDFDDE